MNSKVKQLKRRIAEHLYNEIQIMKDMLEANLSDNEYGELREFMLNHPAGRTLKKIVELDKSVS